MSDDELLDVLDAGGRRVGTKARGAVHRDGDWHRAFHLWVVDAGGVLLQHRSEAKKAWPGYLDATAAGHLVAGEEVADGLREVREELGVAYAPAELHALGVHRVDEQDGEGANRELQHVFAVRDERALEAWTGFDRTEVDGLVLVGHEGFAALAAGRAGTVPATAWDGARTAAIEVAAREVVPAPYLREIAPALARLAEAPEY
jgi:isopentenyldiphosphate isomerase